MSLWSTNHTWPGPFRFTCRIYSITVDVSGELVENKEVEMRIVMAR
ncbi:MAG: hypothetical protein AB9861_04130 [Methanosarcina sp.]